jgi:hypothetical protein
VNPSNTRADLRDVFAAAGFDRVISHFLRKTVTTLMDQAGLPSRAAADQRGHAHTSMTTDVYFGHKNATTGAAAVLETSAHSLHANAESMDWLTPHDSPRPPLKIRRRPPPRTAPWARSRQVDRHCP